MPNPETLKEKQIRTSIARRIKEIRESKSMTQFDLSNACGLIQSTISKYETGDIAIDLMSLIKICEGLGCSIDYLLGRDSDFDTTSIRGKLLNEFGKLSEPGQELMVTMIEIMNKQKEL